MSGHGDQLEHLIEHIAERNFTPDRIQKQLPHITSKLMRDIGKVILKSGNESEVIHLDQAIAQARQLSDGSAIFLFKEHNPENRSIVFADFSVDGIFIKFITMDEEDLTKTKIYALTEEQKSEVIRQIRVVFGQNFNNCITLSMALLANVPEGYQFWYSTLKEEYKIDNSYTTPVTNGSDVVIDEMTPIDHSISLLAPMPTEIVDSLAPQPTRI